MDIIEQLSLPFPRTEVQTRQQAGKTLMYIDAHQGAKRLNKVCGANWQSRCEVINERAVSVTKTKNNAEYEAIEHTFDTCTRIGVLIDGEYVWREGVGSSTDTDRDTALKGSSSESFKTAAAKWGVGAELYRKGRRAYLAHLGFIEFMTDTDEIQQAFFDAVDDFVEASKLPAPRSAEQTGAYIRQMVSEAGEDLEWLREKAGLNQTAADLDSAMNEAGIILEEN